MRLRKITPGPSDQEHYTSRGGLIWLGQAIRLEGLEQPLQALGICRGIRHGDMVKSYLGLLCIGKSDFEARPLLMRLDSGHDALEDRVHADSEEADSIIKWNPRRDRAHEWLADAERLGRWADWDFRRMTGRDSQGVSATPRLEPGSRPSPQPR